MNIRRLRFSQILAKLARSKLETYGIRSSSSRDSLARKPATVIPVDPRSAKLPSRPKKLSCKYSMVVPCYNVSGYIDSLFYSIFSQAADPENIEVIAVDDGSTDETKQCIKYWSDRFPGTIRYIFQNNQRQSVARNKGLDAAAGEWVSFPDADDFISPDYVERVDAHIASRSPGSLSMVSCNFIYYREREGRSVDSHSLRYRFGADATMSAADLGTYIQLTANSVWFRRDLLEATSLRFDPRVVPTFEDAHFCNRFLLRNPNTHVSFLRDPIYYYRKRRDHSSTLDNAKLDIAWYSDVLRYGHLDLLREAKQLRGEPPRYIQRTILYDLFWRFRYLVDHPERNIMSKNQESEFLDLMVRVLSDIDETTIDTFDLARCREEDKFGIRALLTKRNIVSSSMHAVDINESQNLINLCFLSSDSDCNATVLVDGAVAKCEGSLSRKSTFCSRPFYYEHSFWVEAIEHQVLTGRLQGEICRFTVKGTDFGVGPRAASLYRALKGNA